MMDAWPTVAENDDGIRPAGKPDECFYCNRKVGEIHGPECVIVTKRVKVRYSFEIEIDVPHFWDEGLIDFRLNDSSWCADNAIEEIGKYREASGDECLCGIFEGRFIDVVDATPRRELKKDD